MHHASDVISKDTALDKLQDDWYLLTVCPIVKRRFDLRHSGM